jgi:hypothetical protein
MLLLWAETMRGKVHAVVESLGNLPTGTDVSVQAIAMQKRSTE